MNLLLLIFLSVIFGNSGPKETVDMQITITNINSIKGNVEIGLFNNSNTFLQKGKEYKKE